MLENFESFDKNSLEELNVYLFLGKLWTKIEPSKIASFFYNKFFQFLRGNLAYVPPGGAYAYFIIVYGIWKYIIKYFQAHCKNISSWTRISMMGAAWCGSNGGICFHFWRSILKVRNCILLTLVCVFPAIAESTYVILKYSARFEK